LKGVYACGKFDFMTIAMNYNGQQKVFRVYEIEGIKLDISADDPFGEALLTLDFSDQSCRTFYFVKSKEAINFKQKFDFLSGLH
jgi:hypothetical protein